MLDRLAALAQDATPGPWFNTSEDDRPTGSVATNPLTNDIMLTWSEGRAHADAAFIAACDPTTILALVEVAKAAKGMLAVETEPAGMTPAIVADKAQFTAFMDACEKRVAEARDALRSALKSVEPGQA